MSQALTVALSRYDLKDDESSRLYEYAQKQGLGQIVHDLANTYLLSGDVGLLTLDILLSTEEIVDGTPKRTFWLDTLVRWSDAGDEIAGELYQLLLIALISPGAPDVLRYPIDAKGGARQSIRDSTDGEKYLLFQLLSADPQVAFEGEILQKWILTLQLWLVVNSIHLARDHDCALESHTQKLVRRLVRASDLLSSDERAPRLVRLLEQLCDDSSSDWQICSWDTFRRALFVRGSKFHMGRESKAEKLLLDDLTAVTSGRIDSRETTPTPVRRRPPQVPKVRIVPPDEGDEDEEEAIYPENGDEATNGQFVHAHTAPEQSYVEQRLSANTVYLQSVEMGHDLPWSWNRPLPDEIGPLDKWQEDALRSDDPELQLTGCFIWICRRLGWYPRALLSIRISRDLDDEWSINPDTWVLQRKPPRRAQSWRPRSVISKNWIEPFANLMTLPLIKEVSGPLANCYKSLGEPEDLAAIWESVAGEKFAATFSRLTRNTPIARLTPVMIANELSQRVFDDSGNPQLARMLAQHPQTGLPGSCAYASWYKDELRPYFTWGSPEQSNVIALGSLLNPVESLLQEQIKLARNKISQCCTRDPILYHNYLVSYFVVALWAATGGRPVTDPFESPEYFNFRDDFVYINDKSDGGRHQGRLVPVPQKLSRDILDTYFKHLALLGRALKKVSPHMAREIRLLASGRASKVLPLFFLLSAKNLDWRPVGEKEIVGLELFDIPLPLYLFRHRYINTLMRKGVEVEIVEGLAGHSECGVVTYSDFSPRCWAEDMQRARPAIEDAYNSLSFSMPTRWRIAPTLHCADAAEPTMRPFGERRRQIQRRETHREVIEEANLQIDALLDGREISQLEPESVDTLVRKLLLQPNGLPRTYGAERVRQWEQRLDEYWEGKRKKARIKARFLFHEAERGLVSENAVFAGRAIKEIQDRLIRATTDQPPGKPAPARALLFGALLVCIESRISDARVLDGVLNAVNIRLVYFKRHYYLEYAEGLKLTDPYATVKRFRISNLAARYIYRGVDSRYLAKSFNREKGVPRYLAPLADEVGRLLKRSPARKALSLVRSIAEIVDQANLISLPGIVAGYLSGRVASYSLPWSDWCRLTDGRQVIFPAQAQDNKILLENNEWIERILSERPLWFSAGSPDNLDPDRQQIIAGQAIDKAKEILSELKSIAKTAVVTKLKTLAASFEVSDQPPSTTIILFIRWIADVIEQGKYGKGKSHSPSTPIRYFYSLQKPLEGLGYGVNMLAMDEGDLTEFYREIVKDIAGRHQNPRYAYDNLRRFHSWASDLGVEEPDWDELPEIPTGRRVSAGIVTESDYLKAFDLIQGQNGSLDPVGRDQMTFILLACFRLGLRKMEAVGLLRKDWCISNGQGYLLVRPNAIRGLKSRNARRAVPLLTPLTAKELLFIDRILATYDAGNDVASNKSIVLSFGGDLQDIHNLVSNLIGLLKIVTGNPRIVLHHCRHAFNNQVSHRLYAPDVKAWKGLLSVDFRGYPLGQQILGPQQGCSRRMAMAVARLMGHARPSTGLNSYCHFLGDWADHLVGPEKCYARKNVLDDVFDLDALPVKGPIDTQILETVVNRYRPATLSTCLAVLSLSAAGLEVEQAGRRLMMHPDDIENFAQGLSLICNNMEYKDISKDETKGTDPVRLFLERVPKYEWSALIKYAEKKEVTFKGDDVVSLDTLPWMIGSTRQLLAWEIIHLKTIRIFLDYFGVPGGHITVGYRGEDPGFISEIEKYVPKDRASGQVLGTFRLDRCFYKIRVGDKFTSTRDVTPFCAVKFLLNQRATRNNPALSIKRNMLASTYSMVTAFVCFVASIRGR